MCLCLAVWSPKWTPSYFNHIYFSCLHRNVPTFKQKIAGKSPPTEKFAIRKARRYKAATPVRLPVPVLVMSHLHTLSHTHTYCTLWIQSFLSLFPPPLQEMMYMWNGFSVISKRPELTDGMMRTLESAERSLLEAPGNTTQRIKYLLKNTSAPHANVYAATFLQKMNTQWTTTAWSSSWRDCVWRTRAASRLLRSASTKWFPGDCQWKSTLSMSVWVNGVCRAWTGDLFGVYSPTLTPEKLVWLKKEENRWNSYFKLTVETENLFGVLQW